MAYHKDVHVPSEMFLTEEIQTLKEQLETADTRITAVLEGEGAELRQVPAGSLINLEEMKLDELRQLTYGGQTLADDDLVMIYDSSRQVIRKTTLKNIHEGYLKSRALHPGGSAGQIQIKGVSGFVASSDLTYHSPTKTLQTPSVQVHGGVRMPIKKITTGPYTVADDDYTIVADSAENQITIELPAPGLHTGRIINVKIVHAKKYTLKTENVTIKTPSGTIDLFTDIVLKMNNSSRTVQSDGENWWIISSRGS